MFVYSRLPIPGITHTRGWVWVEYQKGSNGEFIVWIWKGLLNIFFYSYFTILESLISWYGHVQRMAEGRLPKIALKWMPKQKRARGRPKKNWMDGIRKAMNERNLNEGQWEDRKQWSLGFGQRRKTF